MDYNMEDTQNPVEAQKVAQRNDTQSVTKRFVPSSPQHIDQRLTLSL